MRTVIQTPRDADIKLAWNIGKVFIANNQFCKFSADGRSIKQLVGSQPSDGTPDHTANIVETGLV